MRIASWKRTLLLAATVAPLLALSPAPAHAQPGGAKATPAQTEEAAAKKATAFFNKGNDLYKAKKYALALDQFKASYAAVASPNSHLFIARCLSLMGDSRAAYLEFSKVMEEAEARKEKYGPTGDAAKAEREELVPKLALVTISVTGAGAGSTVRVGSEQIPRDQWDKPIPFPPGTVDATLETDGKPAAKQTLTLSAGDKKSVSLVAPGGPPPPPPGGGDVVDPGKVAKSSKGGALRPAGFVIGGIGVVGFGMFAIAGVMSKSTFSDLQSKCPTPIAGSTQPCPSDLRDEVSKGRTQQTLANVGLVVGAVGVAVGVTLVALSFRKGKTEAPASAAVVVSPGYASLRGSF
jgi:hypothetical protein